MLKSLPGAHVAHAMMDNLFVCVCVCHDMWPQTCSLIFNPNRHVLQSTKHTPFITASVKAGNGDDRWKMCVFVTILKLAFKQALLSGRLYESSWQVYNQNLDHSRGRLTPDMDLLELLHHLSTTYIWQCG